MTKSRLWLIATGVAIVAIFAGGWFLVVAPKNADAAAYRTQATQAQQQIDSIKLQLATVKQAQASLPKKQAELADLERRIPAPDPALPSLLRSLQKAADGAGVRLVTVAPGPPAPLTSLPGAAASPAPPANAPVISTIPINLKFVGSYASVTRFIDALEKQQRALLVQHFTVTGPGTVTTLAAHPSDVGVHEVGVDLGAAVFVSTSVPLPKVPASTPTTKK